MMKYCIKRANLILSIFESDEQGATAIEYAMLASLVSVAILTALIALGGGTDNMFEYIMSNVSPVLAGNSGK